MNKGILRVQSFASRLSAPVPEVDVTVTNGEKAFHFITDAEGDSPDLHLEAPAVEYSLDEANTTVQPYSTWDVRAKKSGYQSVSIHGVQIFACQPTLVRLEMVPVDSRALPTEGLQVDIPAHSLFAGSGGSGPTPVKPCVPPPGPGRILPEPIIPERITVHLAKPAVKGSDVTVSFRHYIANVASSEVYPTWPEQALRANIHAQISLALNRIYTEWYPSKGYRFNITNSTSYDQYYVHGRAVFEVMERLTNDIFNTYCRKKGRIEPFYAEYCDGKSVTCPGMKQWGTVDLARQGKNALQILRHYYGNDLEIVRTSNIQNIFESYPGKPLRRGDRGQNVSILQRQLNRITQDYPFLGRLAVDGFFGSAMEETVKRFQKQFKLTADGVVGRATWYKISYIYASVKRLAELTSEGETSEGALSGGSWNGVVLRRGSTGSSVQQMQFWLDTLATFDSTLPHITVDGIFGAGTEQAVRAFQKAYGLTVDGVVGQGTWNALYKAFQSAQNDMNPGGAGAYPGTPLRRGERGSNVQLVQFYLRIAATNYSAVPTVTIDGIFGTSTESSVRAFQQYFRLTADGVVGQATWNKLYEVYTDIANRLLAPDQRPGVFPGTLRPGSTGRAVRELQYYLYLLSVYYTQIPQIAVDGTYGPATTAAVRAWQQLASLTVDGITGPATWASIYKNFAEQRPNGPVRRASDYPYPGAPVKEGDEGEAVLYISFLLAYVGYSYPEVLPYGLTDQFTSDITASVRSFQVLFALPSTGIVDRTTWNTLVNTYLSLMARLSPGQADPAAPAPQEYPGGLAEGSTGPSVLQLQRWLNEIGQQYCASLFIPEDGLFGAQTAQSISAFQAQFGLAHTDIVDEATWDAVRSVAQGTI